MTYKIGYIIFKTQYYQDRKYLDFRQCTRYLSGIET